MCANDMQNYEQLKESKCAKEILKGAYEKCRFFRAMLGFFLPVNDKICHSPFKKVKKDKIPW